MNHARKHKHIGIETFIPQNMARRLYFSSGHFAAKLVACHAVALCGHAILKRTNIDLLAFCFQAGGKFSHGRAFSAPPAARQHKVFIFRNFLNERVLRDFWPRVVLPDIATMLHPAGFSERDAKRWGINQRLAPAKAAHGAFLFLEPGVWEKRKEEHLFSLGMRTLEANQTA